MDSIILIFINLIMITKFCFIKTQLNLSIYRNLPPLYDFDNYDHCLWQTSSKYCMIYAEIESNNYSEIWQNIEMISTDSSHHYRHDKLFFGVCLEHCNDLLQHLTIEEKRIYAKNKTLKNDITNYYEKIHKREEDNANRLIYRQDLEICLNYRFQQKYNLSITTSIEYCEKADRTQKFDFLDISFCAIVFTIILLNIISSIYDYRLKLQHAANRENNDFYKNKISDSGYKQLMTSFSICRNYYRLIGAPRRESLECELSFTYFFRIFALFIVILGHCIMLLMSMQIQNPEFLENYYYKVESILFQNGSAIIQIFFVLAGFLLKLKFQQKNFITPDSNCKIGMLVYVYCFLNRYLRLIPSLVLVILFNATFFIRWGDGPFWRHAAAAEYIFCRENWWRNVFMINNFMLKNSCAQHTWFLAADMQLYEQFLFTAILTSRFKSCKKPLYILFGISALLVPGLITYFYKLEAIHFLKPENYRYLYFKDVDTFYLTYPQFYCNIGGYLVGFLCAEIYLKNSNFKKLKLNKYRGVIKYELVLLVFLFVLVMGLLFSGNLVIHDTVKNRLVLSLYASLYRNIWCILGGFMLLFMLKKMGWIIYEIACLPIFRLMGRISFQTYLWHVTVLRLLEGFYRQPIYLNEFYMFSQIILAFILTHFVAFMVALFVEYPISEVINSILKRDLFKNEKDSANEMKPHIIPIHR
ncbi:uncharacterized protein ACRADG_011514 [Cochliomyia hominivorax]